MSVYIPDVTDDFDLEVFLQDEKKLVILNFSAVWCGPCKKFAPTFEKIAAEYADNVVCIKIDVDDFPDISKDFNISCMPTFVFVKMTDKTAKSYESPNRLETLKGANEKAIRDLVEKLF